MIHHNVCNITDGYKAWSAPPHLRFRRGEACAVNDELQVSDVWLPVVHTIDKFSKTTKGMWFYYARGCSDLEYRTGRTLSAKNRLHAALKLTLNDTCSFGCSSKILANVLSPLEQNSDVVMRALADTLYCPVNDRSLEYSLLSGSDHLDEYNFHLLKKRGYDTLQLLFQPQGGPRDSNWQTEVWDVRGSCFEDYKLRRNLSAVGRHFRCRGVTCEPYFVRDLSERECLSCDLCMRQCSHSPNSNTTSITAA